MSETVTGYSAFLTLIISVITIGTLIIGFFQWKTRQIVKNAVIKETTARGLEELEKDILELQNKLGHIVNHTEAIGNLERQLNTETTRAKEDHERMEKAQTIIQEDVKQAIAQINQLIGKVDSISLE